MLASALAQPARAQPADADEPPKTTVLETTVSSEQDKGLARATSRVLRAELEKLDVVETASTPDLGLEDLQLAVGCMAESPRCLTAIADQLQVQALILSSVERAGETRVLTVTFFDSRNGDKREIVRRGSGKGAENELLEAIPGACRELFGMPPAEGESRAGGESGAEDTPRAEGGKDGGPRDSDLSPYPFVVAGAGVVAFGIGTGLGVAANRNENRYATAPARTQTEVDAALSTLDKARRQARSANALFGTGAALVGTATVMFFLMNDFSDSNDSSHAAVAPLAWPGGGGLVLGGRFDTAQ